MTAEVSMVIIDTMTDLPPPASAALPASPAPPLPAPPLPPLPGPAGPPPSWEPPLARQLPALRLVSGPILGLLTLAAIAGNLGLRTGLSSLITTVAVLLAVVAVWRSLSVRRPDVLALLSGAFVFALVLPLRASTWLAALNSSVIVACLLGAVLLAHTGELRWNSTGVRAALRRTTWALRGPELVARSLSGTLARTELPIMVVLRGAAIALVPLLLLGALLASADQVFAQLLGGGVDVGSGVGHVALTAVVLAAIAGALAIAQNDAAPDEEPWRPLANTEAVMVLGSTAVLFGAFVITQVYVGLGRADDYLASAGISHADYARSGFFQLLWVAALTLVLLATVQLVAEAPAGDRRFAVVDALGAIVSLLTIGIVATAVYRLDLYTDEFGLTTLRWYCTSFALMLGVVFALVAVAHLTPLGRQLPAAVAVVLAATLITVNVVNPEARVAEHNVARVDNVDFDAPYLLRLSADAWPSLLDHRDRFEPATFDRACAQASEPRGYGFAGLNVAVARLDCDLVS